MSVLLYPAVVTGDQALGYQASLPDLPGCAAQAGDLGELVRQLRAALLAELKRLEAEGLEWPTPTPLEGLKDAGGAVVLVDAQVDDAPVRVNISIGERLLRRIDEAAETASMTRSGYIAAAVRHRLGVSPSGAPAAEDAGPQRLYEEVVAAGRKLNDLLGPQSALGRTLADLDHRALEGLREIADSVSGAMNGRSRKGGAAEPRGEAAPEV